MFWTPSCVDISLSGKLAGNTKGSGTSSSLAFEVPRILHNTIEKPKVLIMEEVPMMVSKRFKHNFDGLLRELSRIGYRHAWKIVNATDFGVGQNRERLICVSMLNKDPPPFPFPLGHFKPLRDYLDRHDTVSEDYYLSDSQLKSFHSRANNAKLVGKKFRFRLHYPPYDAPAWTIDTKMRGRWNTYMVTSKTAYDTWLSDNRQAVVPGSCRIYNDPDSEVEQPIGHVPSYRGFSPVRELTTRECFRLMGYGEDEIDRIDPYFSRTRKKMLAGDSVVVDVYIGVLKAVYGEGGIE